jgi:hypothetical protein
LKWVDTANMGRLLVAFGLLAIMVTRSASADDAKPTDIETRLQQVEAELARLHATNDAAMDSDIARDTKEPAVRLYGFIDMGLEKVWQSAPAPTDNTSATFLLGNVNLYFDFRPTQEWSSLIEARLTNYPQGVIDTVSLDPANGPDSTVKWGAVVLERAYIEWHKLDYLSIRVGQFLTPYGIWNVDHGSPTLISIVRPEFITEEMWPTHQLGIEAFGQLHHFGGWLLQYHAYVSNGRTSGVVDTTNDKMFGGRLALSTLHPYKTTFGLSVMHGTFENQPDLTMPLVNNIEYGIAGDASIDLGSLRLRTELTTRRLRSVVVGIDWDQDAYVLAAYRIGATKFEPYVYLEVSHDPARDATLEPIASAGINLYVTPAIQLKAQYSHAAYLEPLDPALGTNSEDLLAAKIVMGM